MMKKEKQRFLPNLSLPSFQSIPRVTAGLKWPPLIGPNIYAKTMTQAPAAMAVESDVLLQLMQMTNIAVPMNSDTSTKNLFEPPPTTSISLILKYYIINIKSS